nr:MAG TPA: hypothetical protein [Caudoviricetes sp.]
MISPDIFTPCINEPSAYPHFNSLKILICRQ